MPIGMRNTLQSQSHNELQDKSVCMHSMSASAAVAVAVAVVVTVAHVDAVESLTNFQHIELYDHIHLLL
jgi:hypothetical protein